MENSNETAPETQKPETTLRLSAMAEAIDRDGLAEMKSVVDQMKVLEDEGVVAPILTHDSVPSSLQSVPMELFCPNCEIRHVDEGEWATTRLHKTHQCQNPDCKHEWRPFEYATVGIAPKFSETHVSDAIPDPKEDGTAISEEAKPQTEEERMISRQNMLKALAGMNIMFNQRPRAPLSDKEKAKRNNRRKMADASRKQNRKNRK